jgi:RimJ/RimL family protein N-acetyltransferase
MPTPYTSTEAAAWLEQITEEAATGRTVTWAVTGEDDVLRGVVNLFDIAPGTSAEIGFWAHPDARGRGLTTRACVLALRHGFEVFDLVLVQGHAALGNTASRHVLEASGLREAGVVRLGTFVRPEGRVDAMKYDVLVEEWRVSRHSVASVISG